MCLRLVGSVHVRQPTAQVVLMAFADKYEPIDFMSAGIIRLPLEAAGTGIVA